MEMKAISRISVAVAFLLVCLADARGDEPGTVLVLNEAPTPLQFTVSTGIQYKLSFPDTRVRLWRSSWTLPGTQLLPDTVYVGGQGVFGDVNADGHVRLDDLITIRNDRVTQDLISDLTGNGFVNDNDITVGRNAVGTGGDTLVIYVEALSASTSLGDVTVQLLTDPDQDQVFTVVETVTLTVMYVSIIPEYGSIGSLVTVTIGPAIAPLAFDSTTTATWAGKLYPDPEYAFPLIPPTEHIVTTFSASQVHEQSPNQANFVIGDGTKISGRIGESYLYGYIVGQLTITFGSISVSKTFEFYVDTPYGFVAGGGGVGEPVSALYVIDPAETDEFASLESAAACQYVATILAKKNELSLAIAPSMFPANIVTFDYDGNEVDRVTVWLFLAGRDDFGPNALVYYSNWQEPIVFVKGFVDQRLHPSLTVVRVSPDGGYWDLQIR